MGYDPKEMTTVTITVPAAATQLAEALGFVQSALTTAHVPARLISVILLATEEVFTNIAYYAYPGVEGEVVLSVSITAQKVELTFIDSGLPHNPLSHAAPNLEAPAIDREIGGLGVFLVRQLMDDVGYEYRDGRNILTLSMVLPGSGELPQ